MRKLEAQLVQAYAAGSWRRATSPGTTAERVGESTAEKPAPAALNTNSGHSRGADTVALTARPELATASSRLHGEHEPAAVQGVRGRSSDR